MNKSDETAEYGVAVQKDEVADEQVIARTRDRAQAVEALGRVPYSRRVLVRRTAGGWVAAG
ncbi:hypothetical protein OG440_38415 (plasmid) [Streptomyces sp. NBC_00637]|uniref:hypothetical protein n=1 Tax=Streptomyces sp. NBC_00637 TaxID=2903667 RepID=UPI002F914012